MLKNKLLRVWAKIVTWFYQHLDNKIEPCFNETLSIVFLDSNEQYEEDVCTIPSYQPRTNLISVK